MVQEFDFPGSVDVDNDALFADLLGGVRSAATCFAGTADPSSGASPAWGADQVGLEWWETDDADNLVKWVWQQLTTGPVAYGWRRMRQWKIRKLTNPVQITGVGYPASPAGADVAFAAGTTSLATILDSGPGNVQDAGQLRPRVRAVLLRVHYRTGAAETIPAGDNCYIAFREAGSTDVGTKLYPQVQNRYGPDAHIWVGLNTSEQMEVAIDGGGGTIAFEHESWIEAIAEEM